MFAKLSKFQEKITWSVINNPVHVSWQAFSRGNAAASSPHEAAPLTRRTHQVRHCTPQNRTGRYPRRSRVYPLVSFRRHPPCIRRKHGFSFHPRTKSCIVTPVVSQLRQSYLIKSSRGRFPSTRHRQVLIKLFLLLRLWEGIYNLASLRALSEPQNRYQDLTN